MGYEHLIGKWIFLHGAARLHCRGKLVRVEEGRTATRLYLHPEYTIYRWDKNRQHPTYECQGNTTDACPAILVAEHFTEVLLQPAAWREE